MKSLIIVVEDNPGVLLNIRVTLEYNNYEVKTATNGKEALDILSTLKNLPDLILSDIKMPEMDGYDLLKAVSSNPKWAFIPFIFLSARTSPEDIRFGKMLGVDDYLTKPFKENDLLASIAGKLALTKKRGLIKDDLEKRLNSLELNLQPSISENEKTQICLCLVVWDEILGPEVKSVVPEDIKLPVSLSHLGDQLFQAAVSMYGRKGFFEAQGMLLPIENINSMGYIFYDLIDDKAVRGGRRQFMLAVIAPNISYFESLHIKKLFGEVSTQIKLTKNWDIRIYWEEISKILLGTYFNE